MQRKRKFHNNCCNMQINAQFKRANTHHVPEKRKLFHNDFLCKKKFRLINNSVEKRQRDSSNSDSQIQIQKKRFKVPQAIPCDKIDMTDLHRIVYNYDQLQKRLQQAEEENKHLRNVIENISMQMTNNQHASNSNVTTDYSIYHKYGYSY